MTAGPGPARALPSLRAPVRAGAPRALAALAALALAAVAALAALALPAAAAPAARPAGPLRVVLDALTPTALRPGEQLQVRGRVVNDGDEPVRQAYARLRLSGTAVSSRAELARLAGGASVRDGEAVEGSSSELGDLEPGAVAPFALTVPADELGLDGTAVHPLSVEVRGRSDEDGGDRRQGVLRTQLAWATEPAQVEPSRLAWLWPLADVPHRRADGVFLDDALAASLGRQGRLERLLGAAERHGAAAGLTLVVDPMLLDDLRTMAGGYTVAAPGEDAPPVAGTGGPAAAAYLARLRALAGRTPVVALPYGDPDAAALLSSGQGELLEQARRRGARVVREVLRAPALPAALPPGGAAEGPALAALLGAGRTAAGTPLVLDDAALPAADVPYTPTGRATLQVEGEEHPVVLTDEVLSGLATAPGVQGRQRFLAETAMLVLERPGIPRAVAVAPPRRWDPSPGGADAVLAATAAAPWLAPETLPGLAATPVPEDVPRGALRVPDDATPGLPPAHLRGVDGVRERVRTVSSVIGQGQGAGPGGVAAGLREAYDVQRLRLVSTSLAEQPQRATALLRGAVDALDAVLERVRVLPADVQLPSLDGEFRLTVANDTPFDVTVRVSFATDQPRVTVAPSAPVTVAAGSKDAVTVTARALAPGAADLRARLTSVDGQPLGETADVRVRVTDYGGAALAVTLGAAALLLLAATRNVVRRVRAARDGTTA